MLSVPRAYKDQQRSYWNGNGLYQHTLEIIEQWVPRVGSCDAYGDVLELFRMSLNMYGAYHAQTLVSHSVEFLQWQHAYETIVGCAPPNLTVSDWRHPECMLDQLIYWMMRENEPGQRYYLSPPSPKRLNVKLGEKRKRTE